MSAPLNGWPLRATSSASPASRPLGVGGSHPPVAPPEDMALAAALGLLLLLFVGCGTDVSNPVAATSTESGIVLEDASVRFTDPPLGDKSCEVNGTLRNRTPDKILTAIEVTAFNSEGSAIATARAELFRRESHGRCEPGCFPVDTLRPGESGFFHELLSDLQGRLLRTCSGVARVALTDAIFE